MTTKQRYELLKRNIESGSFDKEDMIKKINAYLNRGYLTQDEAENLINLIK